jgi:hypothetical protein
MADASRKGERGRSDPGSQIGHSFPDAGRACRREQYRIMANAVAASELPDSQAAAKNGVLAHVGISDPRV